MRCRGRPQRGGRVEAQLAPEELGAGLHLPSRALEIASRAEAPDQKDVRVLFVRVQPNELGGVLPGLRDLPRASSASAA